MGGFAVSYRPKQTVTASSRWLRFFPEEEAPLRNGAEMTGRTQSARLGQRAPQSAGSWPDLPMELACENEI
jgi:hypothetical protein